MILFLHPKINSTLRLDCSTEHNLPDSPFASPTKKSSFLLDMFSTGEDNLIASCPPLLPNAEVIKIQTRHEEAQLTRSQCNRLVAVDVQVLLGPWSHWNANLKL